MKALLHSARIAPKKANLIARMVRGKSVPDVVEALRRTNKKAARLIETLLRSAMANASQNDKQDPQTMVIKTIVVNQGTGYRRGMPKARGQQRPYRKFLSHIEITLGYADKEKSPKKPTRLRQDFAGQAKPKKPTNDKANEIASQKAKHPVKGSHTKTKKTDTSSESSASSVSSVSSS